MYIYTYMYIYIYVCVFVSVYVRVCVCVKDYAKIVIGIVFIPLLSVFLRGVNAY